MLSTRPYFAVITGMALGFETSFAKSSIVYWIYANKLFSSSLKLWNYFLNTILLQNQVYAEENKRMKTGLTPPFAKESAAVLTG